MPMESLKVSKLLMLVFGYKIKEHERGYNSN